LDEKEREERRQKEGEYDGDDESEDGNSFLLATSDDERGDEESSLYKTPAKSQSIMFNMKDAKAGPIMWKSPNGTTQTQTAVRIPCAGTRSSFRKSAKQTGWIEDVIESMFNKKKVLPEVGVEWLIESVFERHRPQFDSFCERKGYLLPLPCGWTRMSHMMFNE
jgi:hypothetical protein